MTPKMTTKVLKFVFYSAAVLAIVYCVALLAFDVRLDYEARRMLCGQDKVCKAKLWMEYKTR